MRALVEKGNEGRATNIFAVRSDECRDEHEDVHEDEDEDEDEKTRRA
jgi:hypothetical protein